MIQLHLYVIEWCNATKLMGFYACMVGGAHLCLKILSNYTVHFWLQAFGVHWLLGDTSVLLVGCPGSGCPGSSMQDWHWSHCVSKIYIFAPCYFIIVSLSLSLSLSLSPLSLSLSPSLPPFPVSYWYAFDIINVYYNSVAPVLCRIVIIVGFFTIFNGLLVASIFAVLVVSWTFEPRPVSSGHSYFFILQ